MIELSGDAYLWVKALHLISVISWMAGMLYLPRLFVYHAVCEPGSQQSETFKIMERRLLRIIMGPASLASLIFGGVLVMAQSPEIWSEGWFYAKLICLAGMVSCHGMMEHLRKAFAEDRNQRSQKYYRVLNEVPTVLMIAIVIFVVVKPF